MSVLSKQDAFSTPANAGAFYERINREWHKPAPSVLYLNPRKNTPSVAPAWMEMNFASWALRPRLSVITKHTNMM
jgi:hypothetical protein